MKKKSNEKKEKTSMRALKILSFLLPSLFFSYSILTVGHASA